MENNKTSRTVNDDKTRVEKLKIIPIAQIVHAISNAIAEDLDTSIQKAVFDEGYFDKEHKETTIVELNDIINKDIAEPPVHANIAKRILEIQSERVEK